MKKETKKKQKHIGQVFTPRFIVDEMLNYCGYTGESVLKKHVIDNSCGDGAFLCEILTRYCEEGKKQSLSINELRKDLETYIHGIDTDEVAYKACLENLSAIAQSYGIDNVKWDLYNQSALAMQQFHGKMDFVVGNPPYVRVHNLDASYDEVKQYKFANGGMTDLYLAFFELGFNMLNQTGKLCYITPSSWLNSVAALNMRQYIMQKKNLVSLTDLGHFQPFEHATAYTIIALFAKDKNDSNFDYFQFNGKTLNRDFVANVKLEDCYIDTYFYLSDKLHLDELRRLKTSPIKKYVSVKNGFATLADEVFIGNDIPDSKITIRTLKASTGKWYKCLYPYNEKGKPLPKDLVFADSKVAAHLESHKDDLLKGRSEFAGWWEFGRTQALLDVSRDKLAINCLCRTEKDFKMEEVKKGEGIYSGLYIITDYNIPFDTIKGIIASSDFVEYVKMLKKYKSGGYYTYNSRDVEQYVNCYLTYKSDIKYEPINQPRVSQCSLELF